MGEPGAVFGPGHECQARSRVAAVKVDTDLRVETPDRAKGGRKDPRDIGIAFEYGLPLRFDDDGDLEFALALFEQMDGRCGKNAIAQGSEAYDEDALGAGERG